ncbi:MAG: purine-nucleoside phosphorylase [Thermoleophilaceae bacterium]
MPIHLNPAAELAERVLLPGDPHRALAVAQSLLTDPKMFNHRRGLWGYTGAAGDGELLTIQSTGMGGPSAAIVCEELIELGARTLIRIGTCGALTAGIELGTVAVVQRAFARDGTSRALGAGDVVMPDAELTAALELRPVTAASVDLFYGDPDTRYADVVEMECATIFQVANMRGARAACVLGVSDLVGDGERRRIDEDNLEGLGVSLGEAAYRALVANS